MSPRTPDQNEMIRAQTRRQIAEAAFELFAVEGYTKTSISAIAGRAGVSKGLIYHYFSSKEEILHQILHNLASLADRLMRFPDEAAPSDKMRILINQSFDFIRTQSGLFRMMLQLAIQPEAIEGMNRELDRVKKEQLTRILPVLEALGVDDPQTEAFVLDALVDGIALGYMAQPDTYPLESIRQNLIRRYIPNEPKS